MKILLTDDEGNVQAEIKVRTEDDPHDFMNPIEDALAGLDFCQCGNCGTHVHISEAVEHEEEFFCPLHDPT